MFTRLDLRKESGMNDFLVNKGTRGNFFQISNSLSIAPGLDRHPILKARPRYSSMAQASPFMSDRAPHLDQARGSFVPGQYLGGALP